MDVVKMAITFKIFNEVDEMLNRYEESIKFASASCPKISDISVSVIVPTRNEARNIKRLLTSLRLFRYRNLEVIVADYVSSDNTATIARSFGARTIEVDKPGVGYASFIATNEAKGDIIIRTDADAILFPKVIAYTLSIFRHFNTIQIVHLGHIYVDSGFIDNFVAFLYDKYWRDIWKTTGHFVAFRKDVRDVVNFNPNLRIGEDFDFGWRVYKAFGSKAFHYSYRVAVPVSARRIKISGRTGYLLGRVIR
uniref:Glycosyltransferase n=1 Tax=Fervidicoccus fontis TaxID=683846 RepID=A0A7J3SLF0_9CREN